MGTDAGCAALFIVSPGGAATPGPALAEIAEADGWHPIIDAGGGGVAARCMASGAAVAVVDARGGIVGSLPDLRRLGGLVGATGAALLVLLDGVDDEAIDEAFTAGATHFLAMPASVTELTQAIRYAARHAQRGSDRWSAEGERRWPHRGDDTAMAVLRLWLADRIAAGRSVGVLRISLSRLDILNAARGRAAGDALIGEARRTVEAIAAAVPGGAAQVAHPGAGDIVVAVEADATGLDGLAARLGAALAQPLRAGEQLAVLGSRWGMALAGAGDDADSLLRRVGEALIAAKASDGAVIRIAGPEGAAPLDSLAIDLHHAIERGEIEILFQPQAPIDGRRIGGVEALARWHHPALGPLGADALFAAADRADLGIALSDHIQRLVLARVAAWPPPLDRLRVALNLTAGDLGRPGFAQLFLDRVAASGFPLERLTVEVTESGAIRDLGVAAVLLETLRAAGCRVALDDFGTGYSSLAYLTALPLDYLKIDKALARGIEGSDRERCVIRAVAALARSLDLAVVAEGIETEAQRQLLAAEGCAFYQGFLLAEPIDEAALTALMEQS
ncbi:MULTISPECIES: EAL domain-containing protein [unclassified Sphingomonas]|uniref:EAL domain-containing protein n=1 Tax=unclassified Sphingomonas TaxID=196159 RepID=UPI00226AE155|nr:MULTISPECIES: EAL domain-containing protein [unclassified Sphingomonas]